MSRIFTLLNYFQNALSDEQIGVYVFGRQRIKDLIIRLNTEEQLFKKGIDSKGFLLPVYSEATEAINPLKKAGTPFTLKDTGDFYRSFVILVLSDGNAEIKNEPLKGDDENGTDLSDFPFKFVTGLTDESKRILAEAFKEEIIKKIRTETARI